MVGDGVKDSEGFQRRVSSICSAPPTRGFITHIRSLSTLLCLLSSFFFTYENPALPQGRLQLLLSSRSQQQEADYQLHRQNLSCVTCKPWDHKQILEGASLVILQQYPAKGSSVQLKLLDDLQANGSWTLDGYLVNIWVTELILNFVPWLLKKSKIYLKVIQRNKAL